MTPEPRVLLDLLEQLEPLALKVPREMLVCRAPRVTRETMDPRV